MENKKILNALKFYMFSTQLKDKIRSGWKIWGIKKERVESVAEHIYGVCMLAIAIDSEFGLDIDIKKTVLMILIHEIEEIKIGDLTPFDKITPEEKRKIGKQAVEEILKDLNKKEEYINLIEEFEEKKTKEAIFAKMCDKLEADLQSKIYCEEDTINISRTKNETILKDERVEKLLQNGEKTIADLFIEIDRKLIKEAGFEEILDYIKQNDILKLRN